MNISRTIIFAVVLPTLLLIGCASRKQIVDLQTQQSSIQTDVQSIRAQQKQVAQSLDSLSASFHSYTAQSQYGSTSLEEKVEALTARLDDIITRMDRSLAPLEEFLRNQSSADTSHGATSSGIDYYDAAQKDLGMGNYDLAEVGFLQYLENNPKSDLTDEARYGLGETYYARKRYPEAIEEYQRVVDLAPNGQLAPAAMLKIGLCYRAQQDLSSARKTWQGLVDKFPRSDEAQVAKQRLDEIKSGR